MILELKLQVLSFGFHFTYTDREYVFQFVRSCGKFLFSSDDVGFSTGIVPFTWRGPGNIVNAKEKQFC